MKANLDNVSMTRGLLREIDAMRAECAALKRRIRLVRRNLAAINTGDLSTHATVLFLYGITDLRKPVKVRR